MMIFIGGRAVIAPIAGDWSMIPPKDVMDTVVPFWELSPEYRDTDKAIGINRKN
jgi:hypothetical protein